MSEDFATLNRHKIGNHFQKNGESLCRSLVARSATRSSRVRCASAASATRPHSLPNPTQAQKLKAHEKQPAHEIPCGTKRPCGVCSGGLPPLRLLVVALRPRPPHPSPPLVAAPFGRALMHGLGNNADQRVQPLRQPCAPSGWTCAAAGCRVARMLCARVITPAGV